MSKRSATLRRDCKRSSLDVDTKTVVEAVDDKEMGVYDAHAPLKTKYAHVQNKEALHVTQKNSFRNVVGIQVKRPEAFHATQ